MKQTSPKPAARNGALCPKPMQVRLSPKASEIVRRRCKAEKRTPPKQTSLIIEQSENSQP